MLRERQSVTHSEEALREALCKRNSVREAIGERHSERHLGEVLRE